MTAIAMTRTDWTGPEGYRGVLNTLGIMAKAIIETGRHPAWKDFASRILARHRINENDQRGEAAALFAWMRKNVRYTRDPHNYEWLQTPLYTTLVKNGDCDCQTMLLSALLMSIGFPVRLVVMGRRLPNGETNYFHVLLSAQVRDASGKYWLRLDPTVPDGFNAAPRPDAVYKSFNITPDGRIVEAKETGIMGLNGNYTLGDFAADVVKTPDALILTTTKGRTVKVPWSLQDLRLVSENDTDKWLRDLRAQGVSDVEIIQIPEVLARLMSDPRIARRASLDPGELAAFHAITPSLSGDNEGLYFAGLDGLGGFFKSMGKALKKAVLPVGAVLAAPFTGGLSLAALPAAKALKLKKKKAAGQKLSRQEQAELEKAEKESPPSASVQVVPGGQVEAPEIKATATKKYLLAGAGIAAVGGGAYALSRRD